MGYKVSELEGVLLDAAVAKAEGKLPPEGLMVNPSAMRDGTAQLHLQDEFGKHHRFSPSTDWAQGGPIIERERMQIYFEDCWTAMMDFYPDGEDYPAGDGPTPLIAAMRAFVSSKFGETVDLP